MKFSIISSAGGRQEADAVVLPYFIKDKKPCAALQLKEWDENLLSLLELDFMATGGEVLCTYVPGAVESRIILLGFGEEADLSGEVVRQAFASLVQFSRKKRLNTLNVFLPKKVEEEKELMQGVLDGSSMANYSFDRLKKESLKEPKTTKIKEISFIDISSKWRTLIDRHAIIMKGVTLAQDLTNHNADEVNALYFSRLAEELQKKHPSIKTKILDKEALVKEGMGLILAVNRGALHDPALIVMEYKGDPNSDDTTVVVGKGISFDTGGLNLKPTGGIETMKTDMGGAATVFGIMQTAASLGIKKNIVGVVAAAENSISEKAYKPGDVYYSHSGKTVEVTNTDAEGRLILADALSYAQKYYIPSRIVDFATLTGGIIVAIGEEATGMFTMDDALAKSLSLAGEITGERVWRMPLFPEYLKGLRSDVADLKNSGGGRKASPCMGAIFLKEFIQKEIPWVHLDIAGTSYLSETTPLHPSYATGVGVRLFTAWIESI